MNEMLIVDGRKYFYRNGDLRTQVTKKKADAIFQGWIKAGHKIRRQYGRFIHVWPEA